MKAQLDCLECFVRQTLRAARIATNDPVLQRRIMNDVIARLPGVDISESPAVLSNMCYEIAALHTRNPDPFRVLKREQNDFALALEPDLRRLLAESHDPLDTALHLSAAGNVIDLGALHEDHIDVHGAIAQVLHERFAVDHGAAFRDALASCRDLLYFLDNAGEIVFDKLLIEQLLPYTPVTAVVKAGPILNDALLEDADHVGLTSICPVIDTGLAYIGAPMRYLPQPFLDRMQSADVILGKGQGNYETLDDFPGNVFLILRAKCDIIARHMGVRYGQMALISTRVRADGQTEHAGAAP